MDDIRIEWLFRKKRALGNFSIENSFTEVHSAWKKPRAPTLHEVSNYSEGFINRWCIIRETRELKAHILHITGDIHFAALAWPQWKGNRPKVVLTIHDIGFLKDLSGLKKWLMQKFWVEWPLRCVDHLVVVSEATKQAVKDVSPWFPESAISVIPTVVPQHFSPRMSLPENSKPIVLHIGLATNKNLARHVKALSGLGVHLHIIGELAEADLTMLQKSGIEFSWKARLTNDEMQLEYANADLLLFASTLEGFGMPIIEANMVGVPVITSDLEPMKSVAGEAALLCNPLDASSIQSAVKLILHDKPLQDRLIQNGFENAKRFSPEKSAQLHQELYNKLTHA
jgi:glycosyltransferase involved in cell wall biosynthesis